MRSTPGSTSPAGSNALAAGLLLLLSVLPATTAQCDSMVSTARLAEFNQIIADNPVAVFAVPSTNCYVQGAGALSARNVCYRFEPLTNDEWLYFQCKHPDERYGSRGTMMHSYFYLGGESGYSGNGFKVRPGFYSGSLSTSELDAKIAAAGARTNCVDPNMNPPADHPRLGQCTSRLSGSFLALDRITELIAANTVMLFGWSQCPCTGIATTRFELAGVCYGRETWDASSEPFMSFMTCLYGTQHHSFIFIGSRFIDNGFRFANDAMGETELAGLFTEASADFSCAPAGEPFFEDFTSLLANNPAKRNYGVAITDIDNDGVFEMVVAGYGTANLAYQWSASTGRFEDIAIGHPTLQDASRQAIGVAACDIDGDGYEELYILNTDQYSGSTATSDRLLERDATTGSFSDMFEMPANTAAANYIAGRSCACTDRDGDGKYGVFVSNYGGPMKLYELDESTGALVDVAPSLGLDRTTGGRALVSAPIRSAHRMDIFANNENGCNFFFRNTGDGYVEEAAALGIADCSNTGRGTTVFDADSDGELDLVYGNWNGEHRMFIQEETGFVDRAPAEMTVPSPIRTVIAADFDNDGVEELFFNNIPGSNKLFTYEGGNWVPRNIGDALEPTGHGTGGAVGDFDGDGRLELLIAHGESASEPMSYFRPRGGADNNWLRVLPLTQFDGPARGATVRLHMTGASGEVPKLRVIDAGSGYLCQMEPVAHFGLGLAAVVAEVAVTWPDGTTQRVLNPSINTLHRLPHPGGVASTRAPPPPPARLDSGATDPAPPPSPPPVTSQIEMAMTLDKTLAEVVADRPAFDALFAADVATELDVEASAVAVLSVSAGSVVVAFRVDNPPVGAAETLAAAPAVAGSTVVGVEATAIISASTDEPIGAVDGRLSTSSGASLASPGTPGGPTTAASGAMTLMAAPVWLLGAAAAAAAVLV